MLIGIKALTKFGNEHECRKNVWYFLVLLGLLLEVKDRFPDIVLGLL